MDNQMQLMNHGADVMRLVIVGYTRVRRDPTILWVPVHMWDKYIHPSNKVHHPSVCPSYTMIDRVRNWVIHNMKVNAGHPSNGRSFEVGFIVDAHWKNTSSPYFYNWVFNAAVYYSKVVGLLRFLGAPPQLVASALEWEGCRPTMQHQFVAELEVQNYLQKSAKTSLGYMLIKARRSLDGMVSLQDLARPELSFVLSPRYKDCTVLIANSLENLSGTRRVVYYIHNPAEFNTDTCETENRIMSESAAPVDKTIPVPPPPVAPPVVPPAQQNAPPVVNSEETDESRAEQLSHTISYLQNHGYNITPQIMNADGGMHLTLSLASALHNEQAKKEKKRTQLWEENADRVTKCLKLAITNSTTSDRMVELMKEGVMRKGKSDPLFAAVSSLETYVTGVENALTEVRNKRKRETDPQIPFDSSVGAPNPTTLPAQSEISNTPLVNSVKRRRLDTNTVTSIDTVENESKRWNQRRVTVKPTMPAGNHFSAWQAAARLHKSKARQVE